MFTKQNIGIALTGILGLVMCFSIFGKFAGGATEMMASHYIADWTIILGIGELLCLLLFVFPKTMNLGALMMSAYWGGAIVFHMAHPEQDNPEMTGFLVPAVFLVATWLIAWLRGMKIV